MLFFILLILLLSFFEFIGDSNFKFFARTNSKRYLYVGIIAYAVMLFFLINAFKHGNLIFTNGMWDGISAILSTILAFFLFHERLSNKLQWGGLILIILGSFLLSYGKIPK
jgi:multidrug transporter EmrE-like cation transporter